MITSVQCLRLRITRGRIFEDKKIHVTRMSKDKSQTSFRCWGLGSSCTFTYGIEVALVVADTLVVAVDTS